jgi:hypothetical protein
VPKKSKKKPTDDIEEAPKKRVSKPRAVRPKTKAPAAAPEPTNEEIRIRAYFISERRHRLALPGDASSDWIEARRQLLAEGQPA